MYVNTSYIQIKYVIAKPLLSQEWYAILIYMKATSEKNHRIYSMPFATVYPAYVTKAEKKGRTKKEVDTIICWLTGYTQAKLNTQIKKEVDFSTFFDKAPRLNPKRTAITGVICGVRIEEIQEPLMREIRYLDKLIDELAKGKAMEKILRA